jgi:hypothetical protein
MAVVINEFEIVPAPAPTRDTGQAESSGAKRPEPDANDIAALVRLARARAERVRAH